MNDGKPMSDFCAASVTNQPFVESAKTKVTAPPSFAITGLDAVPSTFDPFLLNVILFVSAVFA